MSVYFPAFLQQIYYLVNQKKGPIKGPFNIVRCEALSALHLIDRM